MTPERTIRGFLHLMAQAIAYNGLRTTVELTIRWREVHLNSSIKTQAADDVINYCSYLIEKYKIGGAPIVLVDWQTIRGKQMIRFLITWANELILSCFIIMWTFMVYYPTDLNFKANYLLFTFIVYLVGAPFIDAIITPLKLNYKR